MLVGRSLCMRCCFVSLWDIASGSAWVEGPSAGSLHKTDRRMPYRCCCCNALQLDVLERFCLLSPELGNILEGQGRIPVSSVLVFRKL